MLERQQMEPHWDGMSRSHSRDTELGLAVMLSMLQSNDVHGNGGFWQHRALQSNALLQNNDASVRRCKRLALVQS
jgi:hypothetical protein